MKNSEATGVEGNDHAVYAAKTLVKLGLDKEWEVVVAQEDQLQLDLDLLQLPANFDRLMGILIEQVGDVSYEVSASKSGNLHVIITMSNVMEFTERVAWQAIFGSDPVREADHLSSLKRRELNPILLYERKAHTLPVVKEQKLLAAGSPADVELDAIEIPDYSGVSL